MIIFLYGPSTFISRGKLSELKAKFLREVPYAAYNLTVLRGEEASPELLHRVLKSSAFLATKRMVVLENILSHGHKKTISTLHELLSSSTPSPHIIIVWEEETPRASPLISLLRQSPYTQEFPTLNSRQLSHWIIEQFQQQGFTINASCAELLPLRAGQDLWTLHGYIQKLIAWGAGHQKTVIVPDDVVSCIPMLGQQENVFPFLDAVASKNTSLAFSLLHTQLSQGISEVYLISLLGGIVRNMLQVLAAKKANPAFSSQELATKLFLHPFVVRKCMSSLKIFSLESLVRLHGDLVEADAALKSSRVLRPVLFLELAISKLISTSS